MKHHGAARKVWWFTLILLLVSARPLHAREGATLAAMQKAYAMEIDAHARYLAFAQRAEMEQFPAVACLFRATARAESVHAAGHAVVIEQLGGTPQHAPVQLDVRETVVNLAASILNEQRERSTIYPLFADHARSECLYEALASCNYARGAEATHEKMFRAALHVLGTQPGIGGGVVAASFPVAPARSPLAPIPAYHVCLGDGSVFNRPVERCPNCGTRGARIVGPACGR